MRRTFVAGIFVLASVLALDCRRACDVAPVDPTPTPSGTTSASAGCVGVSQPALHGERRQIRVGDETRSYLVDAPASRADEPRSLVLAFHGFRDSAANLRLGTGMDALAERAKAIVLCPDGHEGVPLLGTVGRGWDRGAHETRDLDFVHALLDTVEAERCVDRRRVYATGMSNGGFFASLVGCRMADRFAAVAPVAGVMPLPDCTPTRPVAVLLTFGRADNVVPPPLMRAGRDWWAKVDGCSDGHEHDGCTRFDHCSADLVSCEGPQAHSWPADTTERIWQFFAAHPRD
jgi:polyhydroxybutyrate depolymerase